MADAAAIPDHQKTLGRLLASTVDALSETLASLIDRPVVACGGQLIRSDTDGVLGGLAGPTAVIQGSLEQEFEGRSLQFLFDAADATALSAFMMMTPDDVIDSRRKAGTLDGEDLEAFAEVGNVLCSGIDAVLRKHVSRPIELRFENHGVIEPGQDSAGLLGDEGVIRYSFALKIADYPETKAAILIDPMTAEAWNGRPLTANGVPGCESFEEIPAAEIRGKIAVYLCEPMILDTLRRACRRVGLELERHARTDVPNPSAHKRELVLLDVPVNEDRRFDWCKRLKQHEPSTRVVLLIHHPSRTRVLQGFMSKADVILGWPLDEAALTQKLGALLSET